MNLPSEYFEWFYLGGYFVATLIRVYFTNKYKPEGMQKKLEFTIDSFLLIIVGIGMIIPILYFFTSWFDFANYNLPLWLNWIGIPAMIGFLWLLIRSHQDLHKNWSPKIEILEEQTLVTNGVYRLMRHPMYAAHLLWSIAQVLLLSNWFAGFSLLLPATTLYLYRAPREEKMMKDHFGKAYHDYCDKTNRLIPKITSLFS
jgi:protein-S-isoprenylcysteine O-methyltransferase Ste14